MAKVFVVLSSLFAIALAVIPEHEVTSLPGWTDPLKSKQYSGYINIGANKEKFLHYWLIYSENNPVTDPIALWLNGGPGSSSLIGLFTENGQVATNDNSLIENTTSTPKLFYNNYSWSKSASVLYLEQPAGVGFSYCADNATGAAIGCTNNDTSMALDAYDFLVEWFAAYPEFSTQDFYITGESYAGNYIPLIAEQVMNRTNTLKLKGLLIGNGCWGNTVGMCASRSGDAMRISTNFYYGHALFSERLYDNITRDCGDFSNITTACQNDINQMNTAVGSFDVYNIYDTCGSDHYLLDYFGQDAPSEPYYLRAFHQEQQLGEALNDYACGGEKAMNVWLQDPAVPGALHVIHGAGQKYNKTATDLRPLYKTLLTKYRITIYSGDADACVPFWGSEEWTSGLGYTVTNAWHPWNARATNGHTICAGYATQYQTPNPFQFVTIKGAGHMVPTFKPSVALTLFQKFLANTPF
jgi:carboxypeptidase C (cathepsin A)